MKQRFSKRTRLVSALLTLAMVFTFLPFSAFAAEGDIEIKDINNFPDKKFAADIQRHDTNVDGYLSKQERDNVTEMNLGPNFYGYGRNIESLKGIEYFPKLELLECPYNKITELNTSSNSELKILTCSRNQLTQLNVSGNDALTTLSCGGNQLTTLDVSSNPILTILDCFNNQLTSLDLSNNGKLMSLNCDNNQLTFLDLSNNVKLEKTKFKCSGNKYPITIDATKRTFDLNDLPTGFDVSKASGWIGGTVDGNTLKVDPGADRVTYIYNCGNGLSAEFALTVNDSTGTVTPPSGGDGTGTVTPPSGGDGTGTTTPPSGGDGTGTVTPPSGGDGTGTTTPPSGGDGTGTTTPPSGGDGTGTTTPPSGGDGTGTTTPPSGGDGTGTVTPPSGGDTPGGSTPGGSTGGDGGGAIVIVAAAGAAVAGVVGYGVYNYVSGQKLQALLPEGVAAPENRAQTALLLWNTAGRPEPAEAPAFADVADPDTAKAAQWCVEQGLMKRRLNGKFAPGSSIPAYQVLNAYRKLVG